MSQGPIDFENEMKQYLVSIATFYLVLVGGDWCKGMSRLMCRYVTVDVRAHGTLTCLYIKVDVPLHGMSM